MSLDTVPLAPTSSTPEETEFRPGMSLVTKLILNGLITVGCAVMVAGTTIWSSFAFSSALGDLSNAATTLATSAQNAGAANPDLLAAVETATESAQAAVVRTRILVVLAVALACVLIMTPMAIVIVGVRKTIREVQGSLSALSAGDLTQVPHVTSRDEMGAMADHLRRALSSMSGTLRDVDTAATAITQTASRLGAISAEVGDGATTAASELQDATSASTQATQANDEAGDVVGQMQGTTRRIASASESSSSVTGEAVEVVRRTGHTVERLGRSSAEIESVVSSISSIAEQTNLLALNATIEAARAGEAGKGFAVVANEVKELAMQSGQATEEVSERIGQIQSDITAAVDAISAIAETVDRVRTTQNEIVDAVAEQGALAGRLTHALADASKATTAITGRVAETSRHSDGFHGNAQDLLTAANELGTDARHLSQAVSRFRY
ncbi:methyl-accepting chemotaxis protein [Mobilicoccus massiliensis]|uniref:methyl-accepting chemotaxis protein n=1 Tax=Mobilicoccus massiliensis TaxID=1522310 RepID=UPI0006950130|nr:methyl-accepting chemotaxis protein [Mobilicoccus massiliensis]